jgi:hypothetical protein
VDLSPIGAASNFGPKTATIFRVGRDIS